MYDEDFIRGYTDADIEQAEYEEEGRRLSRDLKRGICHHGLRQGGSAAQMAAGIAGLQPDYLGRKGFEAVSFPDPATVPAGNDLCLHCGAIVASWSAR